MPIQAADDPFLKVSHFVGKTFWITAAIAATVGVAILLRRSAAAEDEAASTRKTAAV